MKKFQLSKILFLICFWLFCAIFISIYDAALLGFKSDVGGSDYNFFVQLFLTIGITLIGASILGTLEVLVLSTLFRKKPLGVALFIKSLIYLSFMLFFISLTILSIYSNDLGKPIFHDIVLTNYVNYIFSARVVMSIGYWVICCVIAIFILHVNDKFGQGVLLSFLLGKYHQPKEESKIFMFMDLKSSTTYAEQLGHLKYSELIQDCFFDLTEIISSSYAKIYQYVGDEVVLTWEIDDGIKNANCLKTFPAFDYLIKSRKDYYINKYGIIPEFKAGLHLGKVTVAEVGELKKELAYHGDVINTAARIQEKCNELNSRILISEQMKLSLGTDTGFNFEFAGNVMLKGKIKSVNIFSVNSNQHQFIN